MEKDGEYFGEFFKKPMDYTSRRYLVEIVDKTGAMTSSVSTEPITGYLRK